MSPGKVFSMLAAMLVLCAGGAAGAQETRKAEPTLKVGDRAPALGSGKWVKGEPVSEFESGKVYVIESWATWCKPCIAVMPHITELQKKYADKGLIVIGQNMWETDPSLVEPFVKEMGEKMDYRVVMDEPAGHDGYMSRTWMAAAGQEGIPCSFIVNQEGVIAWIGHPAFMAPVLEKVIAGEYDVKAQVEKERQFNALAQKLNEAMRAGDVEGALKVADEIAQARPDLAPQVPMVKFRLLGQAGRWDQAYAHLDTAVDEIVSGEVLNEIAWSIVDPKSLLPKKNLDVAMKAAVKADKLTEGKNAAVVDTLARVYFLKGDKTRAIELQKKAVELTEDPAQKEKLKQTLREYEQVQ